MVNKHSISVIIVDDHALVRVGIRYMLEDVVGIKVIGEAGSGEEAVRLARELQPEVILMDVRMPGIGGLEASRKILRLFPDIKILVVTVCNDNLHPARFLKAGVAGYITKHADMGELVRAIRSVYSGQRYVSPEIAQQMVLYNFTDGAESPFQVLSNRELQVVTMIAKGMKAQEMADKMHLSPKTISTYKHRIFKKMQIHGNDVELVRIAMQYGLVDE